MRVPYDILAADGLKALGGVYGYIMRSGLEKPLIDLVYLRASQLNGCAYCLDMHSRDALAHGTAMEKLMLLPAWREAGATFSDRERAALAWTEAVTLVADGHVPDAVFAEAKAALSDQEIADLALAIGLIGVYNRLAIGFRRLPDTVAKAEASA